MIETWFRSDEFIHGACVLMIDWKGDSDDLRYFLVLQIIMTSRLCKNHLDCFCYICGEYKTVENRKSITDFVWKSYYAHFGIKLIDQDKSWAPDVACKTCVERLRQWVSGTKQSVWFGTPMVWRRSTNHVDGCQLTALSYKSSPSAIRPVAHSIEIPIPELNKLPDLFIDDIQTKSNMITKNLLMLMMTMKTLHALPRQYNLTSRVWVTW